MARNTVHILSLESMLGMVQDAAAGSYHLETLTEFYGRESWLLMQGLVNQSATEQAAFFEKEVAAVRAKRTLQFNRRQLVLSGVNDYPNVKESLQLTAPLKPSSFRVAREFEQLRIRIEKLKPAQKPSVRILFWGDYAALNARLNFTKNYFELLGLTVIEPGHSVQGEAEFVKWAGSAAANEIQVLCAKDDDYSMLASKLPQAKGAFDRYVAGKVELDGFQAVFGGQDVYPVLEKIVKQAEGQS
jgi:methylmalonyl-CoA mutase